MRWAFIVGILLLTMDKGSTQPSDSAHKAFYIYSNPAVIPTAGKFELGFLKRRNESMGIYVIGGVRAPKAMLALDRTYYDVWKSKAYTRLGAKIGIVKYLPSFFDMAVEFDAELGFQYYRNELFFGEFHLFGIQNKNIASLQSEDCWFIGPNITFSLMGNLSNTIKVQPYLGVGGRFRYENVQIEKSGYYLSCIEASSTEYCAQVNTTELNMNIVPVARFGIRLLFKTN